MGSWPLSEGPHATVFLAVTPMTRENGCLRVVEGSHREELWHEPAAKTPGFLFHHEVPSHAFDATLVRHLEMEAGRFSMHHPLAVHGSGPNDSETERIGLAIRYAGYSVRCNMTVWPQFSTIPVKGTDRYHHNPVHPRPNGEGIPALDKKAHLPRTPPDARA